ncbi:serine/threonine-protein kinase [Nocardiopsis potens]|uniref:serine/threonine-protein kinase n=1 Tax=Nocardiopsis potens TaxID=1246458 RepID=UPI000347B39D|nr:serine/threonine-protein kinase [Nocardiopsis potens]
MFALTDGDPRGIGPYRLFASLGAGGMGHVYLAAGADRRHLAVKRVLPNLARDAGFRQRFALEVAAARRVESPHTVRLVDADTGAEQPWLASEFIPGPTLIQHIEENGPLPEHFVRRLGADLAAALAAIHGAGLVHRDLKPSNVILTSTGAKLLDFGISRAIDHSTSAALTQTGGVVGSPGYMSPEQAQSDPLTERSDIFSLGCLLAVAATGRTPFDGPSIPQILYKIVYERPDLDALPDSLRDPVGRCLAKNPADRPAPEELTALFAGPGIAAGPPASVASFIERQHGEVNALIDAANRQATLVDDGPTHVLPPAPGRPAPRRKRFGAPVLAAAAAAAALLLIIPLWIFFSAEEDPPTGEGGGSSASEAGGGSQAEEGGAGAGEPTLSAPSAAELCEALDAEGFAAAFGPEWEVEEVREEDGSCKATVRDGANPLAFSNISVYVGGADLDSWLFCPFTDCDYGGSELIPGGESTARPWDGGGVVDGTLGLEMIWYKDDLYGLVRATEMGTGDAETEALPDFLTEQGIALYDLAAGG